MMWNTFPVFILLAILICSPFVVFGQEKNVIVLENGTYSNVLVAIKNDVEENDMIIENLKAMFTSASVRLFSATRQHVYWGQIKILVPATWSRKPDYGVAKTESFQTANIVIHDFESDRPYVENPFECGKQGLAMHMTPNYILDGDNFADRIGPSDKVLVQQWAFYRWGLFEEYYEEFHYIQGALPGYSRPGEGGGTSITEGTRCSREIRGQVLTQTDNGNDGKVCKVKPHSTSFPKDCVFVPNEEDQTATASLLFDTSVNSVRAG